MTGDSSARGRAVF